MLFVREPNLDLFVSKLFYFRKKPAFKVLCNAFLHARHESFVLTTDKFLFCNRPFTDMCFKHHWRKNR